MRLRLAIPGILVLCMTACYSLRNEGSIGMQSDKVHQVTGVPNHIPGVVIFKYRQKVNAANNPGTMPSLELNSTSTFTVEKAFNDTSSILKNIFIIKFPNKVSVEMVASELRKNRNVEYCEPSYVHKVYSTPNDPLLSSNKYFQQVDAYRAWDLHKSSAKVIVGIVDTGCDLDHEDLSENILYNTADPLNGIDDDDDGYTDNFYGWDFAGNNQNTLNEDNDPGIFSKELEHGTHVSGLVSSVSDNAMGTASLSLNAKMLIVKCAADDNGLTIFRGYEGIKYAVDHGAKIINCSWGNTVNSSFGNDIIKYAISKGCLVVAAAGNDNLETPQYPAAYEGVLAVSNVNNDDLKGTSSNYGRYIGISAPGTNILSTTYGNSYGLKSGTSMASPIISSAIALLSSHFPSLTLEQIAEKLKVTSDHIDEINTSYKGKLGVGRLNLYHALTKTLPSIHYQTLKYSTDDITVNGQTVSLELGIKNFLASTTNIRATLSTDSPGITLLDSIIFVGNLQSLETKKIGSFKFKIDEELSINTIVEFKITYSNDDGYSYSEYFNKLINNDYLDYSFNKITTTATSNGRVGYRNTDAALGKGFIYNSENLLYECSLIAGMSSSQLSNNTRNSSTFADEDFQTKLKVHQQLKSDTIAILSASFDDLSNNNGLKIIIDQKHKAFKGINAENYIIVTYSVTNTNNFPLNNFYLGLFTDWDISDNSNDLTKFDKTDKVAYAYAKKDPTVFAGVKLLNENLFANYYPLVDGMPGNPLSDSRLTKNEKFELISSGIKKSELGENISEKSDICSYLGYGPVLIKAKSTTSFSFALLAGNSLEDIIASGRNASKKSVYDEVMSNSKIQPELKTIFPNPVYNTGTIAFFIPESGRVSLTLFDPLGKRLQTISDQDYPQGLNHIDLKVADLASGMYFYEMKYKSYRKALKMLVIK